MKYALMGVCVMVAATLGAQETFKFNPKNTLLKPAVIEHTCLHVTWDKPTIKVKTIEVFLLEQLWYENINNKMPDWRERITDDNFDAAEWKRDGGPRLTRHRLTVVDGRAPTNFIDQRASYVTNYVEVLLVDKADKRHNVKGLKVAIKPADTIIPDAYYLSTYQPSIAQTRVWDKKQPVKLEWKLPAVGDTHEIQKLWFVGMSKVTTSTVVEGYSGGVRGFITGQHKNDKPNVQKLWRETTGVIVNSPFGFLYPSVYAELKDGTLILCPFKKKGSEIVSRATSKDKKSLSVLALKEASTKLAEPKSPVKKGAPTPPPEEREHHAETPDEKPESEPDAPDTPEEPEEPTKPSDE